MIRVVCRAKLKSDVDVEEYLRIAKEVVAETVKEEGCRMYTLNGDIHDPTIFSNIEEWVDEEAIEKHNKSEHVKRLVPELRKLRESTEINVYREVK